MPHVLSRLLRNLREGGVVGQEMEDWPQASRG